MFEKTDLPQHSAPTKATSGPAICSRALPYFVLSFAVSVCLAAGCQTPYESGLSEFKGGEYRLAEQYAKRGLNKTPEDPQLNLLLARTLVAQKNYRDAEAYADQAYRSGKLRAEAGRTLGKIQWELGRSMDAAVSWKAARAAKPDSVSDTDYQRALESALNTANSIQNFEKTLQFRLALAELAPEHPKVAPDLIRQNRQQLAFQLARQGKLEASIDEFEVLIKKHPEQESYLQSVAQLLEKLGRTDDAKATYERFIQLAPADARTARTVQVSRSASSPEVKHYFTQQAYDALQGAPSRERTGLALQLAAIHFNANQDEDAKQYVEEFLSDMKALSDEGAQVEAYFRTADLASKHKRPKYALELLERGHTVAPSNWRLTEQLAGLYTRRARRPDVERVLKEFVERSPEPYTARLMVARWAAARRNYNLAQYFIERALEDQDRVEGNIWLEAAQIYAALGRNDRLKIAATNYLKSAKRNPRELRQVAQIYRNAKMYKEAEGVLARALKDDPKSLQTLDDLADLYNAWGKTDKIEPYYDRWIAAGGNRPKDYTMIGTRFIRRGNQNQAVAYLRKGAQAGDTDAWLQIATVFRQQRRHIDMRQALQAYIDASNQSVSALRAAKSYYQSANMTNDEIAVLETLLASEDQSDSFRNHTRLGELYILQGRQDAATAMWADYLNDSSESQSRLIEASKWFDRYAEPDWVLSVYTQLFDAQNPDPLIYKLIGNTYLSIAEKNRYRRGAPRPGSPENGVDAVARARHFYRLYLRHASPSRTELLDFASSMKRREQWAVAADAYKLLLDDQSENAPLWLNYGQVLLEVGKAQEGISVLKRYASQRQDSLSDMRQVGDALMGAKLYTEAEPYFEQLFNADPSTKTYSIYAFRRLTTIYKATRRSAQLSDLADRYLASAQNPTQARQEVLTIFKNAGMYAQTAAQVERIRAYQGNVMGHELAENQFRAGNFEKAYEAFKKDADADAFPGEAWVRVATFYAEHGRAKRASEAFKSAIDAAPENATVQFNYALFLLRQGQLDRGMEYLEAASAQRSDNQRENYEYEAAKTLTEIGRYKLAADIARKALERGNLGHKEDYTTMLTRYQLATQSPAKARRTVATLKKSSIPLRSKIQMLLDNGFQQEAGQWLEEEITHSDYYSASQILRSNVDLVAAYGGFERLENAFKPLIERQDESANANAEMGYMLMRQGQYSRAVPYLKTAEARGFSQAASLLADAYGALGLDQQASRQYRKVLANTSPSALASTLQKIGSNLELMGKKDAYIRLLRALTNDGKYASVATPILAKSLIQSGQIEQAFDLIYKIFPVKNKTAATDSDALSLNLSQDADITTLVGVLNALAEGGYLAEARTMYERLTRHISADMLRDHRLQKLALRLTASAPGDSKAIAALTEQQAKAPAGEPLPALHRARVLQINGHFEAAESVARQAFSNSTADTQKELGNFLLGNALASGNTESINTVVDSIIDASGDKLEATKYMAARLSVLGQDRRALALSMRVAENEPTAPNVRLALVRAQIANDLEAVKKTTAMLLQVGSKPTEELKQMVVSFKHQQRPELTRAIYSAVRDKDPASLEIQIFDILVDFQASDVESARAKIGELLKRVEFDPVAVQVLLAQLDAQSLFVESARVVAPLLKGHNLSRLSQRHIGIALRHIGQIEASDEHLHIFIEMSPNTAQAATEVAGLLLDAEFIKDAQTYAEQAIKAEPTFLTPYFYRGAARLNQGDIQAGHADLAKSIGTGVERYFGLYHAAYYALKSGHDQAAIRYLKELLASPTITLDYSGARLAMMAFIDADRAETGVEFIETNYPQIAAGTGNLGDAMISMVAGLYGEAGRKERVKQLYETAIAQLLASDPLDSRTIVYMNNLAYTYGSKWDADEAYVARGFDLVRRAIAAGNTRSPSYLDTLGWLYFGQNSLDKAEQYIRGSLRTSNASQEANRELIEHIIAIEEARGNADTARWLSIYHDSLR